jgi:hypothetical protein
MISSLGRSVKDAMVVNIDWKMLSRHVKRAEKKHCAWGLLLVWLGRLVLTRRQFYGIFEKSRMVLNLGSGPDFPRELYSMLGSDGNAFLILC